MVDGFGDVEKIWMNGKLINWQDAKIHVLSHGLHYGSGVFEGIRCYSTPKGSFVFRLTDHLKRLFRSAIPYKITIPYSLDEIKKAVFDTIKANKLDSCYIRPIAFYGYHSLGVGPGECPVECVIATWPWGAYLGEEAIANGIRCTFSSWVKIHPKMLPVGAKATGQYINSMLAGFDAKEKGFDEAILLDNDGYVAEGPGENIFLVNDGVIHTPSLVSALPGITRDSAIRIAEDLGYEVVVRNMTRGEVLIADEIFLTGTAAEVTPVREIDGVVIGDGKRGPVTEAIQKKFFRVVNAEEEAYMDWLEPVE
ncbi:MAG: branched-chain amino acid transaminase [Candidatus Syntropharchaeales archaeon]